MTDDARFDLRALLAECREYVEQCEPGNTIKGRNHVTEFLARLDAALAGPARAEDENAKRERASVVKWLRSEIVHAVSDECQLSLRMRSEEIERGEHRREERK
jgi:hypothetical protein